MATLDRDDRAVIIRIVYDGPPTSGKTTSLRALAERFGQRPVYTPEEIAGRTLYFDWMEYTGGRFDGREIRCQIISAPGQESLSSRRQLLLASADAIVFVADTSPARLAVSVAHLENLMTWLGYQKGPTPGVVMQANKRDVPGAEALSGLKTRAGMAVVESVASTGDGVREAFVFAVRLALDRAREQQRRGELRATTQDEDPAGALLRQLKALPLNASAEELIAPKVEPVQPTRDPSSAVEKARVPRLPDVGIASGWVWPPIQGRMVLREATASTGVVPREMAPGSWMMESPEGWRFYSSEAQLFDDVDAARAALIRWAQVHATVSKWLSSQRCIALCETGEGTVRLWQVVRTEPSLWNLLSQTLSGRNSKDLHDTVDLCHRAVDAWVSAPEELPCTLESVGVQSGEAVFIGMMPELEAASVSQTHDPRTKLRQQMDALLKAGHVHTALP